MSDTANTDNTGLKAWLRELLHGRGPVAAALQLRHDEQPYEPAARRWQATPDALRPEFLRIVRELVEEAATVPWTPDAFHQLAFFIETAALLDVGPAFENAAAGLRRSASPHRDQLLMIALRTLLALGWTGSPEFWRSQERFIAARWPELIFKGLARHDLDDALDQLPRLIQDAGQMRALLQHFPGLLRKQRLGLNELRIKCRKLYTPLPDDIGRLMRDWFQLRAPAVRELPPGTNPTLLIRLDRELHGDMEARGLHIKLAGSARDEERLAA